MNTPLSAHELRDADDHLRERRQVGAEALEQALELRDHEHQQDRGDDERDDQHGGRIGQRLLDLLLDRLGLFLVGGDLVEQVLQRARLLARVDQVHEQVVEVQRVLGEGVRQGRAAFEVHLDRGEQLLHARVLVARRHDVEGLHQRDARLQHGRELPAEDRDVLGRDLAERFWNSVLWRRIWVGTRPWRRRLARTAASLTAITEPLSTVPFWSLPCHLNGYCFAAWAMACYSSCSLFIGGASQGSRS
jgi:hypothetical protein